MKAKKQTTAIIIALFLGFITLNAQTTVRRKTSDKPERATVKRTEARQIQSNQTNVRKTTQARQSTVRPQRQQTAHTRQTTIKTRTTHTRQSAVKPRNTHTRQTTVRPQNTQVRLNTERPAKNTTTAYRPNTVHSRPISISNRNNPKSDYRAPEHRSHVKKNKFSEKRYYSGKHYHNVYPGRNIKTHYHHNTYIHHYNVLYYPSYHEIYWTRNMYRDYKRWYPNYKWRYDYGYRIQTMSVFDAKYNMGELAMVYGRVYATWHNKETDDYLLFFGGDYPTQQFTVVLPGHVARRFNWRPDRYFLGEHMTVSGLITTFDGIPEIIVKNKQQVGIY